MAENINELRARAEAFLRNNPHNQLDSEKRELSELIHELSVYQIELEMQNNQLKLVQDELLNSNVSFYKLYNEAPVGYVIIDLDNRLMKANQAFLNYVNARAHAILKRPLQECFTGDSRLQLMAWMHSDKVNLSELELEVHDGQRTRYLQVSSADVDAWNGQPCRFLVFTDISESVEAKRESAISAAAINAASEGCFVVDGNQHIIYVNPALLAMFGYEEDEIINTHPRTLKSANSEIDFSKQVWQDIVRGRYWQEELWLSHKDGHDIACLLRVSPISDGYMSDYSYVAMVSDITERKKYQDTIIRQATEDSLTGLPNRSLLIDRLKNALAHAHRHGGMSAVLFMDLDGFKEINDTLGHNVGDTLLVEVAERLKATIRESDTLARMGGDEFVFIINETSVEGLDQLCSKILLTVSQPYQLEGSYHEITASLGIAWYPEQSQDENELLRLADQAMYEAKRRGKNCFVTANTKSHISSTATHSESD